MEFAKGTRRKSLQLNEKKCHCCGKSFKGIYNRKYCDSCKSNKKVYTQMFYRKKSKVDRTKEQKEVKETVDNKVIRYRNCFSEDKECRCETCGKPFMIKLITRVDVYPKHCEEHRNAWKREVYKRQNL